MSKNTGKHFELIIEHIQRNVAKDASVKHDIKVLGKSGITRQLDITLTQRIGLHNVFIVIECKDHGRPVGIELVESFSSKLADVRATQGVMISKSGFTDGARAAAKELLIGLYSYRQAHEQDWSNIFNPTSWLMMYFTRADDVVFNAVLTNGDTHDFKSGDVIFNEDGTIAVTADDMIKDMRVRAQVKQPIGRFDIKGQPESSMYVVNNKVRYEVDTINISGTSKMFEYIANLKLAHGHVLMDTSDDDSIVYTELTSEGINWQHIVNTQEGRELSEEDLSRVNQEGRVTVTHLKTENLSPYIRLVVSKTDENSSN